MATVIMRMTASYLSAAGVRSRDLASFYLYQIHRDTLSEIYELIGDSEPYTITQPLRTSAPFSGGTFIYFPYFSHHCGSKSTAQIQYPTPLITHSVRVPELVVTDNGHERPLSGAFDIFLLNQRTWSERSLNVEWPVAPIITTLPVIL